MPLDAPATAPAPAPHPSSRPTASAVPIGSDGNGVLPPATPSELSQALGSAKTLSPAEAAALGAAFKAIDDGRYADARAAVANFNNPLLTRIVDWSDPARRAQDRCRLRLDLALPAREPGLARARGAAPPGRGPHRPRHAGRTRCSRYFTAFPPLTSAGHMRRLEAASTISPTTCRSSRARAGATPPSRRPTRRSSSTSTASYLSADDQIARFDRIMREGRAQVARDLAAEAAARLPAGRQRAARDGDASGGRADRAARRARRRSSPSRRSSSSSSPGCAAPATSPKPRRSLASRRATRPTPGGTSASSLRATCWRPAVPPTPTPSPCSTARPRASPSPRPSSSPAGSRSAISRSRPTAQKHFQTLYDGVSTDISKSRAAYWLGRTDEAASRTKEAQEWYGRAAAFGQTFYGQLAAPQAAGRLARRCRAIRSPPTPTSRRWPAASW